MRSAPLQSALLMRKGTARPSTSADGAGGAVVAGTMLSAGAPALSGPAVGGGGAGGDGGGRAEGERVKLSLRLDAARHLKLKLACAHLGLSAQAILLQALDRYLAEAARDVGTGECACLAAAPPHLSLAAPRRQPPDR